MDNTPNYTNSPVEQKPSRKKTIWLVIIILALIASNTGWALFYLKQQGELTTKINTLTAQNLKLTKDNKDLQNADSNAEDTSEYREIPELGVKYKVTDDTKNLTYVYDYNKDNVRVSFSSMDLEKLATKDGDDAALACAAGTIVLFKPGDKQSFTADPNAAIPIEEEKTAKKVGANYYMFIHSQATCSDDEAVNTLESKVQQNAKKAFDSLQSI